MPDTLIWLGAGFSVVWLCIAAYVLRLSVAQREVTRRLERLESRQAPERTA